jgi:uncharacterized protein YjdB
MLRYSYALLLLCLLLVGNQATAQYTWANASSGTWSTSGNWSPAAVPTAATVAQFNANPTSGNVITLSASTPAAALSITSSRSTSLSIAGSTSTTLTLSGTSFTLTGASSPTSNVAIVNYAASNTANLVVGVPLSLGASPKTFVCAGGTTSLAVGNTISITGTIAGSSASTLTFLGGGTWDGTTGTAGGIMKLSAANNPFSGQIVVGSATGSSNCGILEINTNNTLSQTNGANVLINSGSQLYINLASATSINQFGITLNGSGNNATGYGRGALRSATSFAEQWSSTGTGNFIMTLASNSVIYPGNTLTLNGNITGAGQLIKEGPGILTIAGASNTLSGGIKVCQGQVRITKPGSLIGLPDITFAQLAGYSDSVSFFGDTIQSIGNISSSFSNTSGTYTQTLALGTPCTLTINQTTNGTFGRGTVSTLTSVITGGATSCLVKSGGATLTLSNGGHTFYGGLTITAGELRLAPAVNITLGTGANLCPVNLNGGTLSSIGIAATDTIYAGVLNILSGSTISLDASVTNAFKFSSMGAGTGTVTIYGWQGGFDGTAGTKGKVFVATTASLTAAQLLQFQFVDGAGNIIPATQLSNGEIVPKAPISIVPASYGPFLTSASNVISVGYSTTATYFTGNFRVQLSDATGAFSNFTSNIIGTGTSANSGTISATIPSGLTPGSYKVRVLNTTPYTVASDDNGSVISISNIIPIVNSLNAYSGVAQGNAITITGSNFNSTLSNNIVYFGAVKAKPSAGSSTWLTVTVPFGATMGPLSVFDTTTKYYGSSAYSFSPAFDNSFFVTDSLSFQPKVDYTASTCPNIAIPADLDGDGLPDLIAVNKIGRTLTIFQNQGTGVSSFSAPLSLPLQGNPSNVKVADIDGDGRPDIIIATGSGGSSIGVYRNTTNFASSTVPRTLSFGTRADVSISSITLSPGVLGIGDFDGDGRLDIAAACYNTDPAKLVILRNTNTAGGGTVNSFALSSFTAGANPTFSALTSSLCVGDFNGDRMPDIAMVNQNYLSAGTLSVFRNTSTGPGITSFATPLSLATGIYPVDVQSGDMDGDGATDIVVTNSQSNSVALYRNTYVSPATSLSFSSQITLSTSLNNPAGVAIGDLDGDGKAEIVASNFIYSGSVNIYKNRSTAGSPLFTDLGTFSTGKFPAGISIGDLNGDGYPEIVTGNTGNDTGNTISVIRNTPVPIVGTISPASPSVCIGSCTTLTYSLTLPSGETGAWSSSNSAIATVNPSTGVVYGLTAGTVNISYTVTVTRGNISRSVVRSLTVNPLPSVSVTGYNTVCPGTSTTLVAWPTGGVFSNATSATTVNTSGVVTGVASAGVDTIRYNYTSPATGCSKTDTQVMTITPLPDPGTVTGADSVCPGASTTFVSSGTAGGRWYSSSASYASVDSVSGVVTGVMEGGVSITYRLSGSCGIFSSAKIINVQPATVAAVLSGASSVCVGASTTISPSVTGGVWSSSTTSVATVSVAGVVSGVATGGTSISYTVNGACGSAVSAVPVTVNTVPAAPAAITGAGAVCIGRLITLSDTSSGGVWTSSNTEMATVDASGNVNGLTAGSPTISYSLLNICGLSAPATKLVTVLPLPDANITSAVAPCYGNATNIVISGTNATTATYNVDGGGYYDIPLSGGPYSLNTGILSAAHTYMLHYVSNAACTVTKDTSVTLTPQNMIWQGGVIGSEFDWHNAGNWSCGTVPTATDSVIVSLAGYIPVVVTSAAVAKSITILATAEISLGSSVSLSVARSLVNNGRISGAGTVVMNGTTAQTIKGSGIVNNLQISNSNGVTIDPAAHVKVVHSVVMQAGILETNDSLELASQDTTGSAYISAIPVGASIRGKVQADQYVQGGYRRFRFWSHPFADTMSLGQIQQYIDITGLGGAANGFTTTTSNAPSAFRYNPLVGNDTLGNDPGWKAFTKINAAAADTNKLHPGQGIRLFFRGAKGEGLGYLGYYGMYTPSSVVVKMTGNVNQGPVTVKMAKGSTNPTHQEFNMLGNPYPSPVDIGTILYNAKQSGNVTGSAFYLWAPSIGAGGQYIAVPIGTSAPEPYRIPAYAAFQVRAAHNGDSLNFVETDKRTMADNYLFRKTSPFVTLNVYDENDHLWDMLRIRFDSMATDANDNDFDAVKPMGSDFNFYSLSSDNSLMAIDARPFANGKVIPLGVSSNYAQSFVIKADNVVVPEGKVLVLHDKLLDKYTELTAGAQYSFAITGDRYTQGNDRLELQLKPAVNEVAAASVMLTPNPASDVVAIRFTLPAESETSVRIVDVTGTSFYNKNIGKQIKGSVEVDIRNYAPGIYMVEVAAGNQKITRKLIKE